MSFKIDIRTPKSYSLLILDSYVVSMKTGTQEKFLDLHDLFSSSVLDLYSLHHGLEVFFSKQNYEKTFVWR